MVKYEALADADDDLLDNIARFVGHAASPATWRNPFDRMKAVNPQFFTEGRLRWQGDPQWTPLVDGAFFRMHGTLMEELGYANRSEVTEACARLRQDEIDLIEMARSLVAQKKQLESVCAERQAVIDDLHRACEERLALIEQLSAR